MPDYAKCDYCNIRHLIGELRYYRFNDYRVCANCHLKHNLPHWFHELEACPSEPTELDKQVEAIRQEGLKMYEEPEPLEDKASIFAKARLEKQAKEDGISYEEAQELYGVDLDLPRLPQVDEPMLPQLEEEQPAKPKKEEQKQYIVITAFSYSKAKHLFRKQVMPDKVHEAAYTAETYIRYQNVDFVVMAKMHLNDVPPKLTLEVDKEPFDLISELQTLFDICPDCGGLFKKERLIDKTMEEGFSHMTPGTYSVCERCYKEN